MVVTKLVYDYVFKRRNVSVRHISYTESCDTSSFSYSCGEHTLVGCLYRSAVPADCLIVLVPGFGAELERYSGLINGFINAGFDVFGFDCTGCGKSNGKTSVGFPQVINDLNATLDFIEKNSKFCYSDIFLFGHSRGGYAACCVLNEHKNISAAIAVNSVNRAMDGIMAYSVDAVGKIAYGNYYFLWLYQSILFGTGIADRSAVNEINKSDVPVLVIQAEGDEKLAKNHFSLYAGRKMVKSPKASFVLYNSPKNDGHTSVLYDSRGIPNPDIIEKAVTFFKKNTKQEELFE